MSKRQASEILNILNVTNNDDAARFKSIAEPRLPILQKLEKLATSELYACEFAVPMWCEMLLRTGERTKALENAHQKLRAHLAALPDDVFFLSGLTAADQNGYVAMLRYIREIGSEEVYLSPGECRMRGGRSYRIARLAPRFLFHMTRKLAAIFSDVALPAIYGDRRGQIGQKLATSLVADGGKDERADH